MHIHTHRLGGQYYNNSGYIQVGDFFLVPKFQLKNLKQSAPSNVLNLFVKKKHTHTYFEINSSETAKTLV